MRAAFYSRIFSVIAKDANKEQKGEFLAIVKGHPA